MTHHTIKSLGNIAGKKILLRVDLNSDAVNGKIVESPRIEAHSETIKFLQNKKAKIVILAHQGTPGKKDCLSLKQHAKLLNKYVKIRFVPEVIGKKSWSAISSLKSGEALLLENVRYLKSELEPSANNDFVNFMKELEFDFYVNDAFSVCHRNQTSIVSFPKVFPSAIGLVLENELRNVEKLKSKIKNCLFILGGAKSKDLMPLLGKGAVLSTGKLSLLCLIAKGYNLGKENALLKKDFDLIPKIRNLNHVKTPIDLAVNANGRRKELNLEGFPQNYPVWDIGKKTMQNYIHEIKNLKGNQAIFFKGAPGMFEFRNFSAGGSSSDAIKKFGINKKKFGYVSLSGGALVKYLAGEKLPGLEALK